MNKQQLASKIWESANQMRSKIEANEYKDYILGFIFYKFLSESEVKRLKTHWFSDEALKRLTEDDTEILKYVQGKCGYFIAYDDLFSSWIDKGADFQISDVRDALSAFDRNIDPYRKKVFGGIFETLQTGLSKLGTDARSQSKAARDLIYLIKNIPMDSKQDYDVLGFIYEYLISNFAANAGKKAGEFYTPSEVSQLMSEIVAWHLEGRDEIKIYDPTSGSGSLLISIGKAVARRNGNPQSIKYYAQELKENTYNLTRMNLVMRGILPDNIVTRNGDTLEHDWPYFDSDEAMDETYEPLFVDAVVSNPPYSQHWNPPEPGSDMRFNYGIAPKSKADYAFLLHDLYHLRSTGIMAIVLPHGVLFRGGEEGTIRKNLIENHNIQAIIGLPANIFFGTGIPTIIMVLRKNRDTGDVLIVDASKHFVKETPNNKLRASDIKRIVDVVTNNRSVEKFSRVVSIDEIRSNDYNLNIPRYVDSSDEAETWDIYASMFGGVPQTEAQSLSKYWDAWPNLKSSLYDHADEAYLSPRAQDIAQTVKASADVKAFCSSFADAIAELPTILRRQLIDACDQVDAVSEEAVLATKLEELLSGIPLVDPYDAYQILDDAWRGISIDLEVIQTEGLGAVSTVEDHMVFKKSSGSEVQDGWEGKVLPFDLVQKRLLSDDLAAIDAQSSRIDEIEQELAEILEGLNEEDKSSGPISEDGESFSTNELKKTVKAIGKQPETEFEKLLVKAQQLLDEEKRVKKSIKTDRAALEEKTKQVIESLDTDQCKDMLEAKWIEPLQSKLGQLSHKLVDDFIAQVEQLNKKYTTTYSDVCKQIDTAEFELAGMLDDLTGNDFDMAGIAEFKRFLAGE